MKTLLLLLLTLFANFANAKNYYISLTGNDANNGLTPLTAWKTITKFNTMFPAFVAGDSILFKKGETFYGTITPSTSGITIAAYGTGANPIITGLNTVSSWSSLGGNIWEATVPRGLSTLNMVVLNNSIIPMGRTPNADSANSGYRMFESTSGNNSITDNQLNSTINWSGAELVARSQNFITVKSKITTHTGGTVNFATIPGHSFKPNMGYFIQNDVRTLDQNGEWYYDTTGGTKKIKMYYTSTPPSIQVATLTNLVRMAYHNGSIKSNITFKGISFIGSNEVIFQATFCNNLTIDSCIFSFAGLDAINNRYSPHLTIKNSTITSVNNVGIRDYFTHLTYNLVIKNNTIKKIALHPGMLSGRLDLYNETEIGTAIQLGSPNALVEENIIDSIGYCAIRLGLRDSQIVRKNAITNFCSVKNDGGAIYSSVRTLGVNPKNVGVIIENNIISKSNDASNGTDRPGNVHARGIYLDANSSNIKVLNNIIFDVWDGIYISQAQSNIIRGNTVYNTGNYKAGKYISAAFVIGNGVEGFQQTRYNSITNNVFFGKKVDQLLYYQTDRHNSVDSIGIIDSNYFANPINDYPTHLTNTTASSVISLFSLKAWKSNYSIYDTHSKGSPIKIPQFTYTTVGLNKTLNEFFTSNITGSQSSSVHLNHTLTWDNTSQITGAGSAKLTSNVSGKDFTSVYQVIGPIEKTKKYILKFKTKGNKNGSYKTYIQQWTGSYAYITSFQMGSIGVGVEQHEVVFSGEHSTQPNAAIFIQFSQDSSTVYLDDVQFFEATVTPVNVDEYLRFEYNPTNFEKKISLLGNYMSVDSTFYSNTVTLQPYTSIILLKKENDTAKLLADAGKDISLILPINSTTLIGTATGNVSKYQWKKVLGPSQFSISTPNSPSTIVSNLKAGKYTFQLKITNSSGDSSLSNVQVIVSSTLPVKLIDFTAKTIEDKITLKWHTSSEINVSYYGIERSSNGQIFKSIGEAISYNRTNIQSNYSFNDNLPLKGVNFYRLAMVDKDGAVEYSKIIVESVKDFSDLSIINLSISSISSSIRLGINSNDEKNIMLAVADVNGRMILTSSFLIKKGYNAIEKIFPTQSTGVYYVKLIDNNQSITRSVFSGN